MFSAELSDKIKFKFLIIIRINTYSLLSYILSYHGK